MTGIPLLLKAALPSVPVVNQLPGVKKAALDGFTGLSLDGPEVTVERSHVDAYATVCGFPVKDVVPLTYPHLLAFPLHMGMMTDPAFPAPAIGTVHLENSVTGHRPIAIGESLIVSAGVGAPKPHPKGTLFDFRTEVRAAGDLVWESTSTYLRRGRGVSRQARQPEDQGRSGSHFPDVAAAGPVWKLRADLGRRYAAVSGDHNPIHLYAITAKALGFPRQIAHGMWSKARCIAAIENRLPDAVRVDVMFKKPIILPGSVAFGSTATPDGHAFVLANPKSGAPHVVGVTTAL